MAVESAENRCPGQPMTPTCRAARRAVGATFRELPSTRGVEGRRRVEPSIKPATTQGASPFADRLARCVPRERLFALVQWLALGASVGARCGVASAVFLLLLEHATSFRERARVARLHAAPRGPRHRRDLPALGRADQGRQQPRPRHRPRGQPPAPAPHGADGPRRAPSSRTSSAAAPGARGPPSRWARASRTPSRTASGVGPRGAAAAPRGGDRGRVRLGLRDADRGNDLRARGRRASAGWSTTRSSRALVAAVVGDFVTRALGVRHTEYPAALPCAPTLLVLGEVARRRRRHGDREQSRSSSSRTL